MAGQHSFYYLNGSNNRFTFNGLEFVVKNSLGTSYAPQAPIIIHQNDNILSVAAGGTLSNNTCHWFRVGEAGSTIKTGDSTFQPAQSGQYYAYVTNPVATQLTRYSDTVDVSLPFIRHPQGIGYRCGCRHSCNIHQRCSG